MPEDYQKSLPPTPTAESSGANVDQSVADIGLILDIPLEISVELGRTRLVVNDLLKLNRGSVIELGKPTGDPLDIFANKKLIARGEVVAVNEKYGIRITEIVTPVERIERSG